MDKDKEVQNKKRPREGELNLNLLVEQGSTPILGNGGEAEQLQHAAVDSVDGGGAYLALASTPPTLPLGLTTSTFGHDHKTENKVPLVGATHTMAKPLLHCVAKLWNVERAFVIDSGAALEGVLAEHILPPHVRPNPATARIIKVGDGRSIWSEGEVQTEVDFGPLKTLVNFTVLRTTAFDALLGIKFLRRNPVTSLSFHPPELQFGSIGVPLLLCDGAELRLCGLHDEAYKLVPSLRASILDKWSIQPKLDLFANRYNHTEDLYCCPRWSAWGFNWSSLWKAFGCLWPNPPFSKLLELLTKMVLEPCEMVLITPEWTGAKFQRLLDRLTLRRVDLTEVEGSIFISDGGHPLPAPHWRCVASLVSSRRCNVAEAELDPTVVQWVTARSRKLGPSDLVQHFEEVEARPALPRRRREEGGEEEEVDPKVVTQPFESLQDWLQQVDPSGVAEDPKDLEVLHGPSTCLSFL